MSLTLEFFSVSWAELKGAIGSSNRGIYRRVLEAFEPEFESVFEADFESEGRDFAEGLEAWIHREIRRDEREPQVIVSLADALGLCALVRHFGRSIGTLDHAAASTGFFDEQFMRVIAQRHLPPVDLGRLLSQPLFGCMREDVPHWGGLGAEELAQLAPLLAEDAPTCDDPDVDQWMVALWNAMGSAVDLGKDLITIYG